MNNSWLAFFAGLVVMGVLNVFISSDAEIGRAIKAGCGQYTSTGNFEYNKD